jgi:hypothetical protein
MEADRKANVDLTHRGVRRPDEKDSINFFLPYLSGLNLNAHARVMEFAAMQFNPLRIGQQGSCCPLAGKGNRHGNYLKGDAWRRDCCRKHRITSIGCPQEQAKFCSSERICHTKQLSKRLSCFRLGPG